MKTAAVNPIMLAAFAAMIVYWPPALLMDSITLFTILDALATSIGIGVVIAFGGGAYEAVKMRGRDMTGAHVLILGLICTAVSTVFRVAFQWTWRLLEEPSWMLNHPLYGFLLWLWIIGAVLIMSAGDVIGEGLPPMWWTRAGVFFSGGLFMGMVLIIIVGLLLSGARP